MTVLGRTLIAFDPYFGRSQSLELHPYLADAASLLPGSREGEEERRAFSDTLRNIAPLLTLNGYIGVDDDLMNAKIGIKSPEAAMIRDGIGRPSSLAFRYLEESVLDLLPSKLSEDIIRKKKHKYSKRYAELAGARKRNVDGEGSAEDYDISASKQDKAVKDAFLESQDLQRLLSDLGPDDSQSVTEEQYDEALALATKHLEHSSMPGHNAVDVHSFLLDGEKHYYLPDVVAIVSTEREERGGKPLAESTVRTRWVKDRKIPPPRRHEGYAVYSSADLDQIRLMAMSLDELGKPLGITGKTATNRLAPLRRKYQREMGFQHRQRLLDGEIG
jgi:hypothetical protein